MFRRRYYCMNNNYKNNSCELQKDIIENQCNNVESYDKYDDYDSCGFEEEYDVFPQNPMLAQSYVPIQYMDKTFKPSVGLKKGTIFPELVSSYLPGQSMEEIEYLKRRNMMEKGEA